MNEEEKKKSSKKKLFLIVGILAVVALLLVGGGFYYLGRPENIMLSGISKLSTEAKNVMDQFDQDQLKKMAKEEVVSVDGKLTLGMTQAGTTFSVGADFQYVENKKLEKSAIDFDVKYGDTSLLGANILLSDQNAYVKLKKFMDQYYYTPAEFVSMFESMDTVNYNKLIDIVTKRVKEEIGKADFETKKEEITVQSKKISTKKISYQVTEKSLTNIIENAWKDIQKEKDLIEDLTKLFGMTKEELKENIDRGIKSLKEQNTNGDTLFTYDVYYTGFNHIVMHSITDESGHFDYYNDKDVQKLSLTIDDQTVIDVTIEENKGTYKVTGTLGDISFEGTVTEKDKKHASLDFKIAVQGQEMRLEGTVVKEEENGTYKSQFDQKISFTAETGETFSLNVGLDTTIRFDGKIDTDKVIQNSKPITEVTEQEFAAILEKIQQDPVLGAILEQVQGLFGAPDAGIDDLDSY